MLGFRVLLVLVATLSYIKARPGNITNEIDDLFKEIGILSEEQSTETQGQNVNIFRDELDDEDREEFEGRAKYDDYMDDDPEIREIEAREYETVMGRIVDVNLAHWVKRREQRKREALNKRTYEENVQESIETANEDNGFFFEQGDMILDCDLYEELNPGKKCRKGSTRTKRNALRSKKRLWTSRVIPYRVPTYMSAIRKNLDEAIKRFHRSTCIRFVPYRGQKNYIYFANDKGCSSKVGKKYAERGGQKVSIGEGCNFAGTITHELLHAIGFFHEQARDDRDRFVEIKWENIIDGFSSQFDKYSYKTIDKIGKDYDFESIMHYDRKAFTKNGLDTIVRIDKPAENFGTRDKTLSRQDIVEINALYDCKTTNYGWTQWSGFTPCDEKCMKERERYCYNSGNPRACGGNVNVYGIEMQRVKCGRHECPEKIDGHWGRWADWTKCNVNCDDGLRTRFRKCNNPEPQHGGKYCVGESDGEDICTKRRCNLGYEDTDFDNPVKPLGMWRNVGSIQWRVNSYFTKTMDTGPSFDHTTGEGNYLYVESSGVQAGTSAILETPWLPSPKGGQCMKFFYLMFGKTMGTMWVTLQQTGKKPITIFMKQGDQGIYWIGAKASIDIPQGQRFQIKFIAQVGQTGYSDFAIDDVYIDPGTCDCQDDYVSCPKWKATEGCDKKKDFMSKHCARSCDTCECSDNDANCPAWAAQPNGCAKNTDFMLKNCKLSCKVCRPPKGAAKAATKRPQICRDVEELQCPGWKGMGECTKNPGFMLKSCALSCGACVCDDKDRACQDWSKNNQCIENEDWMLDNCQRSCHVCICGDNHKKCGQWAKLGECNQNANFMSKHCKKSCQQC